MSQSHQLLKKYLTCFSLVLVVYSFFSYSLTAPNLVLINQDWFMHAQTWFWQTFFANKLLLTSSYTILVLVLFSLYLAIVKTVKKVDLRTKILNSSKIKLIKYFTLISLPLLFSMNALSLDVFNYIFNAKMLLVYQANPHVKLALNFAHDPWVRFMHNIHTPAPYGYGWTLLSLLPFKLGMLKFSLTWLSFRLFSLLSIWLLFLVLTKLHQQLYQTKPSLWQLTLLFLNPLFLIEIISNSHNDLWMLVPALASFSLVAQKKPSSVSKILLSLGLLIFSISTKLASVILVPLWLIVVLSPRVKFKASLAKTLNQLTQKWPLTASLLMFLPLLTPRSKQFLPWYLVWSLSFLPLIKKKLWQNFLIVLSLTSLLRYLPWLWQGQYSGPIVYQQKIITLSLPLIYLLLELVKFFYLKIKKLNLRQ